MTLTATATQRNWVNLGLAVICVLCLIGLLVVGASRVGLGRSTHRRDNWSIGSSGRGSRARRQGRSPW